MIFFEVSRDKYEVLASGGNIGTVSVSRNPFHAECCNVSLLLDSYDPEVAEELFGLLKAKRSCP